MKKPKNHHMENLESIPVKQFRQRLFNMQSFELFGSPYTFNDDVPQQIEALPGFKDWASFGITWDIYWVGLDPRTLKWEAGRHHSPMRKIVTPIRIVDKDERTNRLLETFQDKADVRAMEVPIKEPLPESDRDRAISASLTGKVVIDEPDIEKAERLIKKNIDMLQNQLAALGIKM